MTEKPPLVASRWETPFENADPDRVHLVRVTYPSSPWVSLNGGPHYDLSKFTREDEEFEIIVFNEEDRRIYSIKADASAVRIHDEGNLEKLDRWSEDTGRSSIRLTGSALHRTLSSFMNGEEPTYLVATGWDCVEFICLNEPRIEMLGEVEDSSKTFH